MVKNLPSNARDTASIEDAPVEDALIPQASGQLSPHTATKTQRNQKKKKKKSRAALNQKGGLKNFNLLGPGCQQENMAELSSPKGL